MRFSSAALSLAVAGGALANPLLERGVCGGDVCYAAVTGAAAGSAYCASFVQPTVYPVE